MNQIPQVLPAWARVAHVPGTFSLHIARSQLLQVANDNVGFHVAKLISPQCGD